MKIVLTGGGTGGHFYPLMAMAEAIHEVVDEEKLIQPELFYIGPDIFDAQALLEQEIQFKQSPAGKVRRYFSILNVFDFFKTGIGIIKATLQLYFLYPDVIVSKGGYAAFPTTYAARLLRIPLIIHESDAVPGRANQIASKWARAVAISYPTTAEDFPHVKKERLALIGNPIRHALWQPVKSGAHEFLELESDVPVLLVLGGSQGAEAINHVLLSALPELVKHYQVIHQTGKANFEQTKGVASVALRDNPNESRYRPFPFLNALALRMASGAASIVISRAGAGTIFETAAWGLPSIIIPIPEEVSHDQTKNAYSYARSGAAIVITQHNLTEHIFLEEIRRLMDDEVARQQMARAAREFAKPDAAQKMAKMILSIALEHEE